jgi:indole-3-glycerol phosphate synthase
VLDEILVTKETEVAGLRTRAAALESEAAAAPPPREFAGGLRRADHTLAVIAEIKRRSPSKGALAPDLDPSATAARYAAGGAAALSVLTDGPYFGGSLDDLRAARAACPLPVLRKDFTIDPLQVYEARAAGADAVLLIVAALPDDALLADLVSLAGELGLAALVEVDDEPGLERALGAGAAVVGVTNRDLRTFGEDLSTAERLAALIPSTVTSVAESAIRSPADARRMAEAGFSAVLVGEALVRADDPEAAVRAMAGVRTPGIARGGNDAVSIDARGDPERMVQRRPPPAGAAFAPDPSGDGPAGRAGGSRAALPDVAHWPGGLGGAVDRYPR